MSSYDTDSLSWLISAMLLDNGFNGIEHLNKPFMFILCCFVSYIIINHVAYSPNQTTLSSSQMSRDITQTFAILSKSGILAYFLTK